MKTTEPQQPAGTIPTRTTVSAGTITTIRQDAQSARQAMESARRQRGFDAIRRFYKLKGIL